MIARTSVTLLTCANPVLGTANHSPFAAAVAASPPDWPAGPWRVGGRSQLPAAGGPAGGGAGRQGLRAHRQPPHPARVEAVHRLRLPSVEAEVARVGDEADPRVVRRGERRYEPAADHDLRRQENAGEAEVPRARIGDLDDAC